MLPKFFTAALLACSLAATAAFAQVRATAAKPLAFEVVSIRPSRPGSGGSMSWRADPDGYRVDGQTIWATLMIAYFPQGMPYWTKERLSGAPNWMLSDPYSFDARVSDADRAAWQKQGLGLERVPMLREMLRTLLVERCKLVAHSVTGQVDGYALVVGKPGPKLSKSAPGAALPVGFKLADGGVSVGFNRGEPAQESFHSASMADLVDLLKMLTYHPVVDRTGLTGRYDFTLHCGEINPDHPDSCRAIDGDVAHQWDVDSLGLHLIPIRLPVDTLVIDHIEKPSPN